MKQPCESTWAVTRRSSSGSFRQVGYSPHGQVNIRGAGLVVQTPAPLVTVPLRWCHSITVLVHSRTKV